MIKVTAVVEDDGATAFLVDIGERVTSRRDLNEALATRYVEELQAHWRKKNQKPNRLGGKRTNFWAKAAEETGITAVTDDGATVTVGGESGPKVRIHVLGGTIVPKAAKALTIPIVREAYGLRAAEYEQSPQGGELFTIPRRPFLFEKNETRQGSESLVGNTVAKKRSDGVPWSPGTIIGTPGVRTRSTVIPLAARQRLRPIYFLADSVEIPRDPAALPTEAEILAALQEEAEDWLAMEGGAA
jgi:hypothetical protein